MKSKSLDIMVIAYMKKVILKNYIKKVRLKYNSLNKKLILNN